MFFNTELTLLLAKLVNAVEIAFRSFSNKLLLKITKILNFISISNDKLAIIFIFYQIYLTKKMHKSSYNS